MRERKDIVQREERGPELAHRIKAVFPSVDIYENEEEILLHADMPGVEKEDLSVNLDNGKLYLTGMRKLEMSGVASWEEFGDVEYRRTFSVPQSIDMSGVHAELKEGVLRLHLPKSEAAKPKQIEIKAG